MILVILHKVTKSIVNLVSFMNVYNIKEPNPPRKVPNVSVCMYVCM